MSDIQPYVEMCKRHPETIAVELEKLAQRMGNIGGRLWQVVSDAGHLDRAIANQKSDR